MERSRSSHPVGLLLPLVLVGGIVFCWILGTAASAGPDEPAHVIRSAELIRGDFDGLLGSDPGDGIAELPAWIGQPDPGCYAQLPYSPANCATDGPTPTGTALARTDASSYPIWGHVAPSIGTLGPPSLGNWLPRVTSAAVPVALVAIAFVLARRRSIVAATGVFVALTPMAWFTFGVVNPSSLVIAGGVAVAVAAPDAIVRGRWGHWFIVAGLAAMALPRRDGLIWASVGLGVIFVGLGTSPMGWVRSFSRPQQVGLGVVVIWPLVASLRGEAGAMRFVGLAPLGLIVVLGVAWMWDRWARSVAARIAASIMIGAAGLAAYALLVSRRSNGFDRYYLRLIVHRTGENLTEAIGVLGWLDAPVPVSMMLLWAVSFGVLASVALYAGASRDLWSAASVIGLAILFAWVIESTHDAYSGTYWQGRYYLPLLVFAPVIVSRGRLDSAVERRVSMTVNLMVLVVINVAFAAAMRRWAVGLAGSMLPWDWDTYGTPLPPVVLLAAHIASSSVLVLWMVGRVPRRRELSPEWSTSARG